MKRRSLQKLVVVLLSLNIAMVALLLATVLRSGEIMPAAWAQLPQVPPIPASRDARDVIVAPGQISTNQWGCYVLDTRANTLCIYQYTPADRMLRLQAARAITQDLRLASFNTTPQPSEVAELVEKEKLLLGAKPATAPAMPGDQK